MNMWRPVLGCVKTNPRHADVAFGVMFTAAALAGLIFATQKPSERDPDALAVVLVIAATLPLVWRRSNPLTVLVVIAAATFPFWVLDYPTAFDPGLPLALFAATSHGVDRTRTWRVVGVVVAAATALAFVGAVLTPDEDLPRLAIIGIAIVFTTSAVLGEVMYQRRQRIAELEQRALDLEADLETKARLAAVDERARIAREMHDIVAHGMSTVVVQAEAARRLVDRDPDRAREALGNIETVGRESLTEMRRMLGVLRDPGNGAELAPQPQISDFEALAHHASEAGVETRLAVEGASASGASGSRAHRLPRGPGGAHQRDPPCRSTGLRRRHHRLRTVLDRAGRGRRRTRRGRLALHGRDRPRAYGHARAGRDLQRHPRGETAGRRWVLGPRHAPHRLVAPPEPAGTGAPKVETDA